MPEATGGARLSDLESRWRFDRSPRVFLQLADELRRAGSLSRAIEVLQEGLTHHPESVSGRVALGRAQLEAGDASAAAETLERVLSRDPAQIVASKLLIQTWIRMGDVARARERLDIYRILQERDSEIDDYERRIAAMERSERQPAVFELAGISSPPPGETEAGPVGADSDSSPELLFELGSTRGLAPLELRPDLAPASASWTDGVASLDPRMPFGRIHDPQTTGARVLSFFRAEALFLAPAEPAGAESMAPALAVDRPRSSEALAVEELAAPPSLATADAAVLASGVPSLEGLAASEPISELAPGMSFEQFSTTGFAAEVERESLAEPLADVLGRAGIDAEALPGIVHPEYASALRARPVDARAIEAATAASESALSSDGDGREIAEAAPPAARAEPAVAAAPTIPAAPAAHEAPSATLAGLYLEQGHLSEAEAEFHRVLSSRPDDEAALAGLREVARRRAGDETLSGWNAPVPAVAAGTAPTAATAATAPTSPPRAIGLTQRKVETLRAYLERMRRGRARAHVS